MLLKYFNSVQIRGPIHLNSIPRKTFKPHRIAYRKNGASTNKSLSADPYDIPLQFPVVVEDDAKIG